MKTYSQKFIIGFCLSGFLFRGEILAQTPAATTSERMKAVVYHEYGSPDVLRIEDVSKPVPNDNQLLVRVRAASVNPYDWHFIRGTPYVMRLGVGLTRPKNIRTGVDFAGTVEAVGKNVTQFKSGDEVWGGKTGAFAEYVCVSEKGVARKPANMTFEQAASVPIAGITALQAVRDEAKTQPGQKLLINGASGGVGTFAVQIAKSFGADVTGVCSTRNVDLVRSLGADHVIDYTKEDFTTSEQRYDSIIDNVGNQPLLKVRGVLTPKGKYVMIGGGGLSDQGVMGPMSRPLRAMLLSPFVSQKMGMMMANPTHDDYNILADLMQTGKLNPVIDRTYPLAQLPDAMRYLEQGHARGKVVITIGDTNEVLPTGPDAGRSSSNTGSAAVVLALVAVPLAVVVTPILVALVLNRRFQQRNPEKRSYRWGYYFSIMVLIGAVAASGILGLNLGTCIGLAVIYAILAWFFAQRRRWAWIALTIFSFNPIAWIINSVYLWKRWHENALPVTSAAA